VVAIARKLATIFIQERLRSRRY